MKKEMKKQKERILSKYCQSCDIRFCCSNQDSNVTECEYHYTYPKNTVS